MSSGLSSATRSISLLKTPHPIARRRFIKRRKQVVTDLAVVVDGLHGQRFVGAIPNIGEGLFITRVGLEPRSIAGAFAHQPARFGKAHGVAPDRRQPGAGFVDKVVKIVFPTTVEVADKQQPPAIVDERPVGEVDTGDSA